MTTRLVFDIETDGLLYDLTTIHCICCKDLKSLEVNQFYGEDITKGLDFLSKYDIIIGHNIAGFDIPAIEKLYPDWRYKQLRDTLCMSKLFNPERAQGHSLESYGIQLNRNKPEHEDWSTFSVGMLHRCSEDVEINYLLYNYLVDRYCRNWKWIDALLTEQEFSLYHAKQELEGVDVDIELAKKLLVQLDNEIEEIDKHLYERIPMRVKGVGNLEKGTLPFKKDGTYNKTTIGWIDDTI